MAKKRQQSVTTEVIKPQPGPQENFLRCSARMTFYGGAGGGGKTYAQLLEPLYDIANPKFEAVIFRRLYREIMAPGSLYERSWEIYPQLGAEFKHDQLVWQFPSGAQVRFAHMQYERDVKSWKSSEIALIGIDEATEWTEYQVFYLLSRNRSVSGVRPRMRLSGNPDPDSWAKVVFAPWVDETWPAQGRAESGEVRWIVRESDNITFVGPGHPDAISITFIHADLYDNKILMTKDPGYEQGLKLLPEYEMQRLLYGSWSARPSGEKFKREWFQAYFDEPPPDIELKVRYWDKAATKKKTNSRTEGPDYTAGVLMGRRKAGAFPRYVVLDAVWVQEDPGGVEQLIKATAEMDGHDTLVRWEQEPGASGKSDTFNYVTRVLVGFDCEGVPSTGSKEVRANPLSAQAKIGNIGMVRAWWNSGYLNFLCAFPSETVHDDPVDASSGAFNALYLAERTSAQEHMDAMKRRMELQRQRPVQGAQGGKWG